MKQKMLHIGMISAVVGLASSLTPAGTAFAKANPYQQPETISIAIPGTGSPGYNYSPDDKMVQFLQQKFNVTFKFVTETWSNYDQQAQLWAASGQLPDIFFSDNYYNPKTFDQWVQQGIIKAIPDNLNQYPYLQKIYNRADVQAYKFNGKLYYWPLSLSAGSYLPGDRGIFVRKDWLQKLHLSSQPKTWNDFVNILKAFVTNNPDHVASVVGLTSSDEGQMRDVLLDNNPYQGWWDREGGKWVPGWTNPSEATVVNKLHSLYTQGLLDKDFGNPNNPATTKFVNGSAGAIVYQPKHAVDLEKIWNQAHPNEKFTNYVEFLDMPPVNGKRYVFHYFSWWAADFFNSATVDDNKMNRILAILNYLASPTGREFTNFGFQGKDWKLVNGKIDSLHPGSWSIDKSYDSGLVWQNLAVWGLPKDNGIEFNTLNPVPPGWDPLTWNMLQRHNAWENKNAIRAPINWSVNAYATTLPPVTANLGDWFAQAISSSDPAGVWRTAVNNWMNSGGNKQISEVTAKFKNQK